MKIQGSGIRPVLLLTTLTALVGAQFACEKVMFWRSKPQEMHSGEGVLASEGTVRVSDGDNGNSKVAIRVKHLAPPSKVSADSTVYVVWIQPREGDRQNVGALALNKDLEGSLDTLTPHRRFKVSVTPEPTGQVAEPSHEPVFTYDVESNK
jgi:hypothetical protein